MGTLHFVCPTSPYPSTLTLHPSPLATRYSLLMNKKGPARPTQGGARVPGPRHTARQMETGTSLRRLLCLNDVSDMRGARLTDWSHHRLLLVVATGKVIEFLQTNV